MVHIPGLWRRNNIWQYRRRVPHDVARRVNRNIVSYSLNTADYSTATARCRTVAYNLEQYFQDIRGGHLNAIPTTPNVWHKIVAHRSTIQAPPAYDQDGLRSLIQTVVEEVLSVSAPKKPSITLDDLYHRYMDDPARNRSKKTVMTYQSVYNVLMDIFGADKPIADIDREDCRQFMDVVRHLPANARKKFPRKSLVEISEIARKRKMSPMAPLTINKYISKLAAMLN